MLRYLRITAAVFFALLVIGFVALWVRSHYWFDGAFIPIADGHLSIGSNRGICCGGITLGTKIGLLLWQLPAEEYQSDWHERSPLGFNLQYRGPSGYGIDCSHWFLAASSLGLAALFAFKRTWRYSLRTILVATMLLAAILGLAVYAL